MFKKILTYEDVKSERKKMKLLRSHINVGNNR